MLWIKAFHIIFMVTWFAGLFYLPRLFVYHAECDDPASDDRLQIMERRLFGIMTIGALLTALFGFWLIAAYHWPLGNHTGWLTIKLALVSALIVYHTYCWVLIKRFSNSQNQFSSRWYRWFNEIPGFILVAVVILAVVKPF